MLIFTVSVNTVHAGIGESWSFEKDEADSKDFTNSQQGVIYGCSSFMPRLVSFKLNYTNEKIEPKIKIGNVGVVKKTSKLEYRIESVEQLELTYPKGGGYLLTNETGEKVVGINCDSGIVTN